MLHPTAGTPARPRRMVVFKREMPLYLMLIPGVAFAFVFCYLPMFGLVMAFQNYSPLRSFSGSEWVGLKNFQAMLSLPTFWTVVRNTLMISSVKILLRLLVPLIIALLLNEVLSNGFKRTAQTVFFLPYFLSWAVMGGVLRELFEYDGTINAILQSLGWEPIMFLGSNTWFPIIIIVSDVWKDMGYNMIIFLAAITNVDPALNESAALDVYKRQAFARCPRDQAPLRPEQLLTLFGLLLQIDVYKRQKELLWLRGGQTLEGRLQPVGH